MRRLSYRMAGLVMAVLMGGGLATAAAASPALAQTPGPAPGVGLGPAAPGASSVNMAYTGNPGGWASLGGVLTTGPAAASLPGGDMYVFVLGVDSVPYVWSGTTPSNGGWANA